MGHAMSGSNSETTKALVVAVEPKPSDRAPGTAAPSASLLSRGRRLISPVMNARLAAVGAAGLALGTVIGVVSAPRDRSSEAVAALRAEIVETRGAIRAVSETARRSDEALASLWKGFADAKASMDRGEAARSERLGNVEKALAAGFADLQGRRERDEQELGSRLGTIVASIDKLASLPFAASKEKTDPDTTGAIAEKKLPIADPAGEWALREVLDGVAIIEDRKHRIIEVSRGDVVPGLGRVETVERRARSWAVVTKQGVVVPQNW